MKNTIVFAAVLSLAPFESASADKRPANGDAERVAPAIDGFLDAHWQLHRVTPTTTADDATFLRRITLDLFGRIPTVDELDRFLADDEPSKRQRLIRQLIASPEFVLHFGNVLDQMIQGRYAGRGEFVDYLRRCLRDGKPWDKVFRELMLGPWDGELAKAANQFIDRRARDLDGLTADTARTFFGVDISCAKCHDHPLVTDWTQDHFYGMAAFFNRTTGGKGKVGEKQKGEIKFLGSNGQEKVAQMMFLSGRVINEPSSPESGTSQKRPRSSRREQLVTAALADQTFLSRAIINRLWAYFFGRGLMDPVDQMHSANEVAVPGLLEWLAEDFAEGGYDLHRVITGMVSTRVYQLSSRWEHDSNLPDEKLLAVAQLRPLSPRQLAFSLLLATGNAKLSDGDVPLRLERLVGVAGLARMEQYLTVERRASAFLGALDPRRREFQSSAVEALFMSNNQATQELTSAASGNLADRLDSMQDSRETVSAAIRMVLSRPPRADELEQCTQWFDNRLEDGRQQACEQFVWALVTSAEFRFNH